MRAALRARPADFSPRWKALPFLIAGSRFWGIKLEPRDEEPFSPFRILAWMEAGELGATQAAVEGDQETPAQRQTRNVVALTISPRSSIRAGRCRAASSRSGLWTRRGSLAPRYRSGLGRGLAAVLRRRARRAGWRGSRPKMPGCHSPCCFVRSASATEPSATF